MCAFFSNVDTNWKEKKKTRRCCFCINMEKKPVQYHFFWHGPLSQWSDHGFKVDDILFENAEKYMMYHKAKLFGDEESMEKILECYDPKTIKRLGRGVKGFDEKIWKEKCTDIVYDGNMAKFGQNDEAREALMATDRLVLVEASPYDRIWGIGYDRINAMKNVERWGLNLLGVTLMRVREDIRKRGLFA